MQGFELLNAGGVDPRGGERADHRLQAAQDVDDLLQLLDGQRRHRGTAVGQDLDQPLGRQDLEALAQRRARDAELLAQQPLVEALPGAQHALDDQVAQPVDHDVVQALPTDSQVTDDCGAHRSGIPSTPTTNRTSLRGRARSNADCVPRLQPHCMARFDLAHAARLSHTKCTKTIRPRESADDPPASRPPFPADPGADQRARAHPAGDRQGHDRSSRPRLPAARPRGAGRAQGRVQDRRARHRLPRLGHRRLGGGAGQHRCHRATGC